MEIHEVHLRNVYKQIIQELISKLDDQHFLGYIDLDQNQIQSIYESWSKNIEKHYEQPYIKEIQQINLNEEEIQRLDARSRLEKMKKEKQNKKEKEEIVQQKRKGLNIVQKSKKKITKSKNQAQIKKQQKISKDQVYLSDNDSQSEQQEESDGNNNESDELQIEEVLKLQTNESNKQEDENDIFALFENQQLQNNINHEKIEDNNDNDIMNGLLKSENLESEVLNNSNNEDFDSGIDLSSSDLNDVDSFIVKKDDIQDQISNVILGKFSDVVIGTNKKSGNRKYTIKMFDAWCFCGKSEFFSSNLDIYLEEIQEKPLQNLQIFKSSTIKTDQKSQNKKNDNNETQDNLQNKDNLQLNSEDSNNNFVTNELDSFENSQQKPIQIKSNISLSSQSVCQNRFRPLKSIFERQRLESQIGSFDNSYGNISVSSLSGSNTTKFICLLCQKPFRILKQLQQHQKLSHFTKAYGLNNFIYSQISDNKSLYKSVQNTEIQEQPQQQQQQQFIQLNNNTIE